MTLLAAFFSVLFLRGLVPLLIGIDGPLLGRNSIIKITLTFLILITFHDYFYHHHDYIFLNREQYERPSEQLIEVLKLIVESLKPPQLKKNSSQSSWLG